MIGVAPLRVFSVLASLLLVTVAVADDEGWRDLPENDARNWIMEHARHLAHEFCGEYPANPSCHHAGREQLHRLHAVDFCARYHLRRENYVRDGWQYWRCVGN